MVDADTSAKLLVWSWFLAMMVAMVTVVDTETSMKVAIWSWFLVMMVAVVTVVDTETSEGGGLVMVPSDDGGYGHSGRSRNVNKDGGLVMVPSDDGGYGHRSSDSSSHAGGSHSSSNL